MTFNDNEVGFIVDGTKVTRDLSFSANKLTELFVAYLITNVPAFDEADIYKYNDRVWLAKNRSDLASSDSDNKHAKKNVHIVVDWYIDQVRIGPIERRVKVLENLAEQLNISAKFKFAPNVTTPLRLWEEMFQRLPDFTGPFVAAIPIQPGGSTALLYALQTRYPKFEFCIEPLGESDRSPRWVFNLDVLLVVANPPYISDNR